MTATDASDLYDHAGRARRAAIAATHDWFDVNSGWAEPTRDSLLEWIRDGVGKCPDDCEVAYDGICPHGLASWWLVLRAMGEHDDVDVDAVLAAPGSMLTHAPNFRDVGGITTADGRALRHGIVYRSGVLDTLDHIDISRLAALGVRSVVDLRSDDEVDARPHRLPVGVRTFRAPAVDVSAAPSTILERIERGEVDDLGAPMLVRGNVAFATTHRAMFATVLRIVCDPQHQPVIVNCTAGKDRTGFAVASMLWALGVEQDRVLADYLRSNAALASRHAAFLADARARGIDPSVLEAVLVLQPAYLDAGREAALREFGSIDAWLRDGLGITDAERSRWRDAMLTQPGAQSGARPGAQPNDVATDR